MFEHVRLICFDLDDTLWPCYPVIQAAEEECYAYLCQAAPQLTAACSPDCLRAHRIELARQQPGLACDLTELRLQSMRELLQTHGYTPHLATQASDVFRAARNRVIPYSDVYHGLARLRKRYTLVSVTNGNSQIEKTPLRDCFDYSLTAAEVGAAKPDPAIFHAASECSGIGLEAFLHVGDDPVRDVQAARSLGLSSVWMNREGKEWPTQLPSPDAEAADLHELLQFFQADVD